MNNQWSRAVLKQRAKAVLRKSYWRTFAVCLIAALLGGGAALNLNVNRGMNTTTTLPPTGETVLPDRAMSLLQNGPYFLVILVFVFLFTALFGCAFAFFVANPIQVGASRFLFYNAKSPAKVSTIFSTFSDGCYIKTVGKMAVRSLINLVILLPLLLVTFLSTAAYVVETRIISTGYIYMTLAVFVMLLTVATAIVSVVVELTLMPLPYILAENPRIPLKRAFALARAMTRGQKGRMFVLELSFLGWELLGVLCFGVGLLFVLPYVEATHAELYGALRWNAAQTGICTADEIGAEYFL